MASLPGANEGEAVSWANLDDRLHAHPKVRRLQRIPFSGAEAFGIWCWCLSWCRSFRPTDGLLSVADVAADWGCDPEHMSQVFDLLLSVRLVDELDGDPDAYVIHDWTDWQLTAQQRGGLHGSVRAARDPLTGRFGPAGDQSGRDGQPHGSPTGRTTPLHATPNRTSPAGERVASDQESDFRQKVRAPS